MNGPWDNKIWHYPNFECTVRQIRTIWPKCVILHMRFARFPCNVWVHFRVSGAECNLVFVFNLLADVAMAVSFPCQIVFFLTNHYFKYIHLDQTQFNNRLVNRHHYTRFAVLWGDVVLILNFEICVLLIASMSIHYAIGIWVQCTGT